MQPCIKHGSNSTEKQSFASEYRYRDIIYSDRERKIRENRVKIVKELQPDKYEGPKLLKEKRR